MTDLCSTNTQAFPQELIDNIVLRLPLSQIPALSSLLSPYARDLSRFENIEHAIRQGGSAKHFQWLQRDRDLRLSSLQQWYLTVEGNVDHIKKMHEFLVEFYPQIVIRCACSYGHLAIVEWLYDNSTEFTAKIEIAAMNGHLNVVKFLHGKLGVPCTPNAMDVAAIHGHLDVVKWLHHHCHLGCSTDAMDGAASEGHLNVLRWLDLHRSEGCTVNAMNGAAQRGHAEIFWWLFDHTDAGYTKQGIVAATLNGHVAFLKQFHDRGLFINWEDFEIREIARSATQVGHLPILQWLYATKLIHDFDECVRMAAVQGYLHIIEWYQEHFEVDYSSIFVLACVSGQLDVVKYVMNHANHDRDFSMARLDAIKHAHPIVVKWLNDNVEWCDYEG